MDTREKSLLLEILVSDIRVWWAFSRGKTRRDRRIFRAIQLAAEIWDETIQADPAFHDSWSRFFSQAAMYLSGHWEGKIVEIPLGISAFHGLPFSLSGRSQEFQEEVSKLVKTDFAWDE